MQNINRGRVVCCRKALRAYGEPVYYGQIWDGPMPVGGGVADVVQRANLGGKCFAGLCRCSWPLVVVAVVCQRPRCC